MPQQWVVGHVSPPSLYHRMAGTIDRADVPLVHIFSSSRSRARSDIKDDGFLAHSLPTQTP
jgi:hypothetical protein